MAMFNLAIDSKLRGCDVVALKVEDIAPNGYLFERATIRQKKTGQAVRFELTEQSRQTVHALHARHRFSAAPSQRLGTFCTHKPPMSKFSSLTFRRKDRASIAEHH
jgi:integrase